MTSDALRAAISQVEEAAARLRESRKRLERLLVDSAFTAGVEGG